MTTTFSPKDPGESRYYGIDFANELATGETITSATVTIRAVTFDDADSAAMLIGSAVIEDSVVKHKIATGLDGNLYRLKFSATTSAQLLIEGADLAVAAKG